LKVESSESKTASAKTEFYMKYPLKVILGHSFCNQLQGDNGLHIVIFPETRVIGRHFVAAHMGLSITFFQSSHKKCWQCLSSTLPF